MPEKLLYAQVNFIVCSSLKHVCLVPLGQFSDKLPYIAKTTAHIWLSMALSRENNLPQRGGLLGHLIFIILFWDCETNMTFSHAMRLRAAHRLSQ